MFRPCIDLHSGQVKQIIGSTLESNSLKTNFTSPNSSTWFANLFKKHNLKNGHVIMLGPGNEQAAIEALASYPLGLQIGGGITDKNCFSFLDAGASHIIITSWLFPDASFSLERVKTISKMVGKDKLVIDLSCKKIDEKYFVATNRWRTVTSTDLSRNLVAILETYCAELLIHAIDIEGQCQGIDLELITKLSNWGEQPITYAGGARSLKDLQLTHKKGKGRIHLTIGSALDIFGGSGITFQEAVAFNKDIQESGI